MFFGLISISAIFPHYINEILAKKLNIFIIIYLKNIFIYIKSEEKNMWKLSDKRQISYKITHYISISKNVNFIRKDRDFLAILSFTKEFK